VDSDALRNRPYYDFARPAASNASFLSDPLFRALIATSALKRLQSIRFLGAIDFMLVRSPNGTRNNVRYTRYQHSLGVARLAYRYAKLRELSPEECRLVTVTGLLHDIGHAPLSHSLEPVFHEYFGLEHHQATSDIILGQVPMGLEVNQVLRQYEIDVERVISLISGEDRSFDGFFSGPINFDTIEAILRALSYIKPKTVTVSPEAVVDAATFRKDDTDARLVDEFWAYKDYIYKAVIGSYTGIIADYLSQHYMRKNISKFSKKDYYLTEKILFNKLPGLQTKLRDRDATKNILDINIFPLTYNARSFSVAKNYSFFKRDDARRYVQFRYVRRLSITGNALSKNEDKSEMELYDLC